jgi:hypothetical protein
VTKTEKKSAIELKAKFVASNIALPERPGLKNLGALAEANIILATKLSIIKCTATRQWKN